MGDVTGFVNTLVVPDLGFGEYVENVMGAGVATRLVLLDVKVTLYVGGKPAVG